MKCLALKLDAQRLTVMNLEEDSEVVLAYLLRIVKHMQVHLFTWSKRASPWLDLKDFLVEDVLFKCLLLAWSAGVCPGFHLNLRVVRHLKVPVCLNSTHILE